MMKQRLPILLTLTLLAFALSACNGGSDAQPPFGNAVEIVLADDRITVDGQPAGTDTVAAVYTARDIVYYEAGRNFAYGEGAETDAHSPEEAAAHTVVHITQPGTYLLRGSLSAGQVAVDLGEKAEDDPAAVVTLVLHGVDITCTVAPAIIFYNVYECGITDVETAIKEVDTSAAGANIIIADGCDNVVRGSYVARIYKPESVELSEDGTEVADAKNLHKYDAAFYSRMSMNIDDSGGKESGTLKILAENEGLDSELHLTINGGNITIRAGNDGINTNEDGVSVTTINGGYLNIIVTGETGEGDGIDSNGWLVINGGTVIAAACANSADSGIDSDMGIHINGGTVIASGDMLDRIKDGGQNYAVFSFGEKQSGGTEYTLTDVGSTEVTVCAPVNDFTILLVSAPAMAASNYSLLRGDELLEAEVGMDGGFGGMMPGGRPPEGLDPSKLPEGMERPESGMRPPKGFGPLEGMGLPAGDWLPEPPQGGVKDGLPGDFGGGSTGVATTVFAITDGENLFTIR